MKKIMIMLLASILLLVGCGTTAEESGQSFSEQDSDSTIVESGRNTGEEMQIRMVDKQGNEILFQLNDSSASETLYEQLPFSVELVGFICLER